VGYRSDVDRTLAANSAGGIYSRFSIGANGDVIPNANQQGLYATFFAGL